MSTASQLHDLQEIDLEVDRKRQALAQVEDRLGKNEALVTAHDAADRASKELAELEHTQKEDEWENDQLSERIAQEEKKLYEGSVKNPKELMGLKKEVDLIKEQQRQKEDVLLAVMLDVDAARENVTATSRELEERESAWNREQEQLHQEKSALEEQIAALAARREELARQIDQSLLGLYESLRLAKHGRAVARIEQGTCTGCRISLPMSDQQKARMAQELVTCSNCGRILCM
jgi:hypothetical protein